MNLQPWKENTCYLPVRHWLLYTTRGDYVARVDLHEFDNGRYRWTVLHWSLSRRDEYGYADTLEAAQQAAERVLLAPVEAPVKIGQLALW